MTALALVPPVPLDRRRLLKEQRIRELSEIRHRTDASQALCQAADRIVTEELRAELAEKRVLDLALWISLVGSTDKEHEEGAREVLAAAGIQTPAPRAVPTEGTR